MSGALAKAACSRAVRLGGFLFASLVGCAAPPEHESPGALEGELSVVSILSSDGRSSADYFLRLDREARPLHLVFSTDPNLTSETPIRVWGDRSGSELRVTKHAVMEPVPSDDETSLGLIGQPARTRTVAWVQMDVNGEGVTQTKEEAQRIIFGQNPGPRFGIGANDKSVAQYYEEASYGTLKLTGQVEGPIPFSGTACNNFDPLARDVVAKVTALGRTYDHYYLYWGSRQPCGPGWGQQGRRDGVLDRIRVVRAPQTPSRVEAVTRKAA